MTPRRAVFDTNVVISALVFRSGLAWLQSAWTECKPVVCPETIEELVRVLGYPKFKLDAGKQRAILDAYLPVAEAATLPGILPVLPAICRDRKDLPFIHLALAADCPLVSGDADITVLRDAFTIPIVSPKEFWALLGSQGIQPQ